jgi:hypothetical protein
LEDSSAASEIHVRRMDDSAATFGHWRRLGRPHFFLLLRARLPALSSALVSDSERTEVSRLQGGVFISKIPVPHPFDHSWRIPYNGGRMAGTVQRRAIGGILSETGGSLSFFRRVPYNGGALAGTVQRRMIGGYHTTADDWRELSPAVSNTVQWRGIGGFVPNGGTMADFAPWLAGRRNCWRGCIPR